MSCNQLPSRDDGLCTRRGGRGSVDSDRLGRAAGTEHELAVAAAQIARPLQHLVVAYVACGFALVTAEATTWSGRWAIATAAFLVWIYRLLTPDDGGA